MEDLIYSDKLHHLYFHARMKYLWNPNAEIQSRIKVLGMYFVFS